MIKMTLQRKISAAAFFCDGGLKNLYPARAEV